MCSESLITLKDMAVKLNNIYELLKKSVSINITENYYLYKHEQKGKSHFYSYSKTFAATAETYTLDLHFANQLNHIRLMFDDGTSKDFEIRLNDNPSQALYTSLIARTGDLNPSVFIQGGTEFKLSAGTRISFIIANATIGKTLRLFVQVDEV